MKKLIFIAAILAHFTTVTLAQHTDCEHAPSIEVQVGESAHGDLERGAHDDHDIESHDKHTDEAHDEHNIESHDKPSDEDHDDHGHGAHEEDNTDLTLPARLGEMVDLRINEAGGGEISRSVIFPAEVILNRDRVAAISPRYSSVVRKVFAEIGDKVQKDDQLASLENRETLAVYTVSSPLDGVVISKNISTGEAAAEDRVLYEVADLSTVWARISIFPQYRHHIQKGQRVILTTTDGHSAETTIKYISPLVSTDTRTLSVRCVLEGAEDCFTPGAFVRAKVIIQTGNAAIRVEKDAVQIVEGQPVVFIAVKDWFEPRDVVLGLSDRDFIEIKSGLERGDKYVAKGAFELKAEMVTTGLDPHAGHGH
jgi:membrane fusion protein, heavy metal efflux system